MELALYSLSRAVESFALCLAEWGWVRHHHVPKRLDVVIFSLATAVIMHCYAQVCWRVCRLLLSSEAFLKIMKHALLCAGLLEGLQITAFK
jgi:hypothetical protein